jgi:hypothetical protein
MRFHTRAARVFSALALIAVVNVFVFANGAMTASKSALLGRLVTTSNRPILVNGGEAITGTNIISGAQLMTPASNGAMVEVHNLGSVMISPNSNVTVTFDEKTIVANVSSGWASVATVEGVKGSVVGLPANAAAPAPAGGNSAKNWGIAGVAIGSAGFIWALIAWNKANNAEDDAKAAQASAATLASQLAALRTCLAGQTTSPVKLCTSF